MPTNGSDTFTRQSTDDTPSALQPLGLYLLPNKTTLIIEGQDAKKFLQGQVSCDLNQIDQTHSLIGSHSTPKGRMISSFRILQTAENQYQLVINTDNVESALAALKKYIVFSKAEISRSNQVIFGCHGNIATEKLLKHVEKLPEKTNDTLKINAISIMCIDENLPAYELYTDTGTAENMYTEMTKAITPTSSAQQLLIEHKNGIAFIAKKTTDLFIAQMLNYQSIGAISFEKGCYTGQEIIARMKYLGKLKKHMGHAIATCEKTLEAGQALSLDQDGKNAGNVVSAVKTGENTWDILWVLTKDAESANQLYSHDLAISNIQHLTLPYEIT